VFFLKLSRPKPALVDSHCLGGKNARLQSRVDRFGVVVQKDEAGNATRAWTWTMRVMRR
jgi:hypothetical protein